MRRKINRAALVDVITREVAYLARRGEVCCLDALTEIAGWIYNYDRPVPIKQAASVLAALAPVLPDRDLVDVAGTAVFHAQKCRGKTYDQAEAIEDDVLRAAGVDVDRRNAEFVAAMGAA